MHTKNTFNRDFTMTDTCINLRRKLEQGMQLFLTAFMKLFQSFQRLDQSFHNFIMYSMQQLFSNTANETITLS